MNRAGIDRGIDRDGTEHLANHGLLRLYKLISLPYSFENKNLVH